MPCKGENAHAPWLSGGKVVRGLTFGKLCQVIGKIQPIAKPQTEPCDTLCAEAYEVTESLERVNLKSRHLMFWEKYPRAGPRRIYSHLNIF